MAELGRIEKPGVHDFAGKRKLYCVPHVFPVVGAPDEYRELVGKFWDEAALQITRLEVLGKVQKVFCENVLEEGEEALKAIGELNAPACRIVREKVDAGAAVVPIEREDILGPFLDWRNCLHVARSREAVEKILGFYRECFEKRIQHILSSIEEGLSEDSAGLLILSDEDRMRIQFPPDIEVFLVTPPVYDDILRWVRDRMRAGETNG